MTTNVERRAAQRRLAKEIRAGNYKPSAVGRKAREVASERKEELLNLAFKLKKDAFGDRIKWNNGRAFKYVQVDPGTGENRGINELRAIVDAFNVWKAAGRPEDWHGLVELAEGTDESSFYYH